MVKIVTEKELEMYSPSFLGAVKRAWETKQEQVWWEYVIVPRRFGVVVHLKPYLTKVWEIFPRRVVEKIR